ncbi:hypothetical protein X474_22670 [Dethiosulfatarculus sandiegensis]|uniref:Uncharacterized protein n=1 Tax=Dethiosulfatarculus sandiegensis TaxID=1429043 RepID=A0A0D2GA49_9BACT|nr:hypothetical protein X474_22670 [Dethiosulfatarculus sandiegensis]
MFTKKAHQITDKPGTMRFPSGGWRQAGENGLGANQEIEPCLFGKVLGQPQESFAAFLGSLLFATKVYRS